MRRKHDIVAPDRRLGADRVANPVLGADQRGEVEQGGGDQVGGEAEGVGDGEVDRAARGRLPLEV